MHANRSPRHCRLNELERWVDTTQYDNRKHDWFADTEDAPPLRERRPCIAYPIVRTAIDSNVDLCLGEGKFPAIALTDGDDSEGGEETLSEEDKKRIDKGITKLVQKAKLKAAFRRGMMTAQGCGTAVMIVGARDGVPFAETEQAKRCTVERDARGIVERLEIRYPYTAEVKEPDGKWRVETRLYRRIIDTKSDVTFIPVLAPPDGREVTAWSPDPERSVNHGLGFCPVVWYAHMVAATTAEQVDGRAIHAHCMDEIEALDVSLSQWHRAAFYAGDPQLVETGADDRGPMADGVGLGNRGIPSSVTGGKYSDDNPVTGFYQGERKPGKAARRKGPGIVWHFDSKDAKVDLLSLPGDALKSISDNARDLRDKVAESLGVVFSDPETVRFASALSGKAQQMLRQRQLDRCDQYRDDLAEGLIIPSVQMLLRVCRQIGPGVKVRAIRDAATLSEKLGEEPGITLRWGAYYAPDPAEEKQIAEFLVALDKVLPLPLKWKLQKLQRPLDIENVEAALAEFASEQGARDAKATEQAEAGARALAEAAHGNGPVGTRDRSGAAKGPPEDVGGGGGAPPAAAAKGAPPRK